MGVLGRKLFVSADSAAAIEEALSLTFEKTPWSVYYLLENRTNADLRTMRRQRGPGLATLYSFLNLEIALEADAWVCMLSSNWCQLIDELRMTVGAKASSPYVNIIAED